MTVLASMEWKAVNSYETHRNARMTIAESRARFAGPNGFLRLAILPTCFVMFLLAGDFHVAAQEFRIQIEDSSVQVQSKSPQANYPPGSTAQQSNLSRLKGELTKRGIEATTEGIRKYLNDIHPNDEQNQRAYELIGQLGDESFAIRELATQKLFRMPALPVELLEEATRSPDPEIAWRANGLLEMGKIEFGVALMYVLQYIAKAPVPDLTPELLRAFPLCTKNSEQRLARDALLATYTPAANELLKEQLTDSRVEIRRAVAHVLANAAAEQESDTLRAIASNNDEASSVIVEAVEGLANLGARDALPILVGLLSADDVAVRVRASVILRQYTGNSFKYAAYDKEERRTEAVRKWEEWLANDAATAELTFPLSLAKNGGSYLNGNTLIAMGYNNKVIELDPEGNEILSIDAQGAWMADRLESGTTIVAAYSQNMLIEFDSAGEKIWEMAAPSILSVRGLENGNILFAQHSPGSVKEVNRNKEVVWEYGTGGSACDAIRLPNGNTLIGYGNNVDEVTPEKEVVWSYTGNQVYGISVIDNGNILVSQLNGMVHEISRETKEVVWEFKCPNPVDALRLPNGNTLITSNQKFMEVTPELEVVWEKGGCNYGSARR